MKKIRKIRILDLWLLACRQGQKCKQIVRAVRGHEVDGDDKLENVLFASQSYHFSGENLLMAN